MKVFATGFFLLWMYLLLHQPTHGNYAEVLWGQCYSFCLTAELSRHEARQNNSKDNVEEGEIIRIPPKKAINLCRKDRVCKWCLYACDRPRNQEYIILHMCMEDCRNDRIRKREAARKACNESCEFISESSRNKFGVCPAPAQMEDLIIRTSCVEDCDRDLQCSNMMKCCGNECGHVCHKPLGHDAFPRKPSKLKFKERRHGGLLVSWSGDSNVTPGQPVVYILRWWCRHSEEIFHLITTKHKVKLKGHPYGIQPGDKCSFVVAAMNIHGSEGFSAKKTHIKDFEPSPPLNLETTRIRIHSSSKVDITLRWQPPHYTNALPVARYLVFWSEPLPHSFTKSQSYHKSYTRLNMHKRAVSGDTMSYTIKDLPSDRNIFIQVRAVVKWGSKSIKGKFVSTYSGTYSPPQTAFEDPDYGYYKGAETSSNIYNIVIENPKFFQSELRAKVTWSVYPGTKITKYLIYWEAVGCDGESRHRKTKNRLFEATSHKQEFDLNNLKSNCAYELQIFTINSFNQKDEGTEKYFKTPRCADTEGQNRIVCPVQAPQPEPPHSLSVMYKTSMCMCQAVISWLKPGDDVTVGQHSITHFSVLWGPSRQPQSLSTSTIVYNTDPYKIEVPGSDSKACVHNLEKSQHYTVQITSHVTSERSSPASERSSPAVLNFVTPEDMVPCTEVEDSLIDLKVKDITYYLGSVEIPEENTTVVRNVSLHNNGSSQVYSPAIVFISLFVCALVYL